MVDTGVFFTCMTSSSESKPARTTGICSVLTRQLTCKKTRCFETVFHIFSARAPERHALCTYRCERISCSFWNTRDFSTRGFRRILSQILQQDGLWEQALEDVAARVLRVQGSSIVSLSTARHLRRSPRERTVRQAETWKGSVDLFFKRELY